MTTLLTTLRPYDDYRKVQILGELWKATKGDHKLRCEIRTHPMGWELLVFVGLDMHRSQVVKAEAAAFETSNQWKAEARTKGWTIADAV
jgi:hypothetical protein